MVYGTSKGEQGMFPVTTNNIDMTGIFYQFTHIQFLLDWLMTITKHLSIL